MAQPTAKSTENRKTGICDIPLRPIADWIGHKCFSFVHSNNLIYNTCWEDPKLDRAAMHLSRDDNVLVITSGGCNTLDYALEAPNHIYAVDVNPRQNALLELKMAGIRALNFDEFFSLFGLGRLPDFEQAYKNRLRPHLSPWAQKYWDRHSVFFQGQRSFYFRGSSGAVAHFMNYYIDKVARIRQEIDALLDATTLEQQQQIYDSHLRDAMWTRFIRWFVGSGAILSLLGVPRQQRQQVEHYFGRGIAEFVEWCIEAVFTRLPIQDNYFWRVYLRGEYSPQCCPRYLMREHFESLKQGLVDRVSVHTETVEGFLRGHDVRISRYVLLDHMDWLSTFHYDWLESEWQAIVDRATENARVLFRSGGMKVEYIDPIQVSLKGREHRLGDMLEYHPELASYLHEQDRVHTYGSFYIADLQTA